MPLVSRTFIKAGMIYFILSLTTGVLLEVDLFSLPALMPLFWHTLMVGWITQIIMGVSIWMYPGRNREEGFRNQRWNWLTFIFLNLGLGLRVVAEPVSGFSGAEIWKLLLVVSAILQLAAGGTYLAEIWPRLISRKKRRQQRKEKRRSR